jgi:hypothetical protein
MIEARPEERALADACEELDDARYIVALLGCEVAM